MGGACQRRYGQAAWSGQEGEEMSALVLMWPEAMSAQQASRYDPGTWHDDFCQRDVRK